MHRNTQSSSLLMYHSGGNSGGGGGNSSGGGGGGSGASGGGGKRRLLLILAFMLLFLLTLMPSVVSVPVSKGKGKYSEETLSHCRAVCTREYYQGGGAGEGGGAGGAGGGLRGGGGEGGSASISAPPFTPPLLYTFPGSGNTWCRQLIEYATGIYTGSFYDDLSLLSTLPGEAHCDHSVSVIKAHPNLHSYFNITSRQIPDKCKSINKFTKAIFLVRDPYDAIWSEFQRRVLGGSHVHSMPERKSKRIMKRWDRVRPHLASRYRQMWHRDYSSFNQSIPTLLIRYEDLRDPALRTQELRRIVHFIGVAHPNTNPNPDLNNPNLNPNPSLKLDVDLEDRLGCAFILSDNPKTNRNFHQNPNPNPIPNPNSNLNPNPNLNPNQNQNQILNPNPNLNSNSNPNPNPDLNKQAKSSSSNSNSNNNSNSVKDMYYTYRAVCQVWQILQGSTDSAGSGSGSGSGGSGLGYGVYKDYECAASS